MADGEVTSKINIEFNAAQALSEIKRLQADIAAFHANLTAGAGASAKQVSAYQQSVLSSINATKGFSASIVGIASETEAFTRALERNDFTMRQYFRNAMGAAGKFSSRYKAEFATIDEVARSRVRTLQTQYINLGRDASGAMKAIQVRPAELDMKNLSTQMAVATQKAQIFHELVRQGSTQLLNWGKNTQWAGRQLMVGFTLPLTMMGASAAKAFMELEKQTVAFKRVYGDFSTTAAQTDAMAKSVQNLAAEFTQYGVAVSDTMGLAAQAAAMGKQGQDLIAQVSETNRLAVLGQVEQSQALETTISLTNAFGVASEDLAKNIDFLNAVENQTVTSIEDLTVAIPKAGPVIKQMGGDVKDLAFFLTAMKEGGINASEGANALKSGIAAIINPTKAASDMLASYGINIQNLVQSNKGDIKGLITDFASALDKLDPLNRAKAIEQMFGKFQFARISTLFQNVIAQGSQANQVLQLTAATTEQLAGLSKTELGKIAESTTYKFEKAMADFQMAIAPVGEQFLKLFTPFIQVATDILNWFNKLDDGVKTFAVGTIVAIGGIAPLLIMLSGLFANLFANFASRINSVAMFFKGMKQGMHDGVNSTRYLSEAELQAQAVAASLDQSHAQLIQTFGLEKAALDELALAYMRLKDTQMGIMNPNIAAGFMGAGPASAGARYEVSENPQLFGFGPAAYLGPGSWNIASDRSAGISAQSLSAFFKQGGAASMAPLLAGIAYRLNMDINDPSVVDDFRAAGHKLANLASETLDNAGLEMVNDTDFERIVTPKLQELAETLRIGGQDIAVAARQAFTDIDAAARQGKKGRSFLPSYIGSDKNRKSIEQFATTTNGEMFYVTTDAEGNKQFRVRSESLGIDEVTHQSHMKRGVELPASEMVGRIASGTPGLAGAQKLLGMQHVGITVGGIIEPAVEAGVEAGAVAGATVAAPKVATALQAAAQRGFTPADFADPGILRGPEMPGPSMPIGAKPDRMSRFGKFAKQFKSGGVGMLAYGVGGLASTLPGGIGEGVAQISNMVGTVAMVVQALSMMDITLAGVKAGFMTFAGALGGLAIPLTIAAGALIALGVAAWQHGQDMVKITKDTIEQNTKLGASYKAMQDMASATGKVLASQTLAKRQSDLISGFGNGKADKPTSGQTYLTTEAGKALTDQIQKSVSNGISNANIGTMLGQQLSAGIASGLMSEKQARSIAAALGDAIQNQAIAFDINGTITQLLTSDGKDAFTNGIDLRVNLLQGLTSQIPSVASDVTAMNAGDKGVAKATNLRFGDNYAPDVSNVAVASDAAIAAAKADFVTNSAAAIAQQREQTAATQLQYESELKILQAKKDQNGINILNRQYDDAKQRLLDQNVATYKKINDTIAAMPVGTQQSIINSQADAIKTMYAGTGQESFTNSALDSLSKMTGEGSTVLKVQVQTELLSGTLAPATVSNIFEMFTNPGEAQQELKTLMSIDAQYGAGTSNDLQQLLAGIGANATQVHELNLAVNAKGGGKVLDMAMKIFSDKSLTNKAKQLRINFIVDHPEKIKLLDKFEKKKNLTVKRAKIIFATEGYSLTQEQWDWYSKLPKNKQKVYLTTYLTIQETLKSDELVTGALLRQHLAELGAAAAAADVPSGGGGGDGGGGGGGGGGGTGGGGGGGGNGGGGGSDSGSSTQPEDTSSFLKEVVQSIRKLQDAGVKIPTTFKAAMEAINKFSNAGSVGIGGLSDKLRQAGANASLISMALDATPEELKNIFKNGGLTDFGKKLNEVLNSLQVSTFIDAQKASIQASSDQVAAFAKLRQNGMEAASAYKLIEDEALASAIANAKNAEEINAVIAAYYAAKKAADEASNPNELAIKKAQVVNDVSQAQIAQYQTGLDIISSKEADINKKYQDRKDALDKIAAANAEIAKQQQEQLDLADALTRGDISAAARAAQTMRQSASASAQKRQSDSLNKARELELKALQVEINGVLLDREEIEQRIKDLNLAIYQIELDTIDAAQLNLANEALAAQNATNDATTDLPTTPTGDAGSTTEGPKIAYFKENSKEYFDAAKPEDWDTMKVKARKAWKKEHLIRKKDALNTELYSEIKAFARGGYVGGMGIKPIGMDRIPAMLKPGEFVVSVPGVKKFGVDNLRQVNAGQSLDSSVYNYSVTVNAGSESDGQEIARLVMGKIKEVDAMRIRGNRL